MASMDATSQTQARWFHLTPGRFVIGLLAIEVLLWLSERVGWLGWHKGYAVLTGVALVGVGMVLMLVWFAVALVFKRQFQFSIQSLMLMVVAVAVPCSWLAVEMKRAKSQAHMVEVIRSFGGVAHDDLTYFSAMKFYRDEPPEPGWIRKLVGDDFFRDVYEVGFGGRNLNDEGFAKVSELAGIERIPYLCLARTKITDVGVVSLRRWIGLRELLLQDTSITDVGLEHLTCLSKLFNLDMRNAKVTNAGLRHLEQLSQLRYLDLENTQVTAEGEKLLQKSLPNCRILR
jgi:hypothetical protein